MTTTMVGEAERYSPFPGAITLRPATIVGFTTMFQLRANAPQLRLRAWLACTGAIAVVRRAPLDDYGYMSRVTVRAA